jgi:hypothetical protein
MSETKKAIGLRLPRGVWDDLKQYGIEHHPSDKGSEGFDVTFAITTLLAQALGTSLDKPLSNQSNVTSDERITEIIKQQLNELLSPKLDDSASDDLTDVIKSLNSQITAIVNSKISEVKTELESYTQQQCEAVRLELKKLSAID